MSSILYGTYIFNSSRSLYKFSSEAINLYGKFCKSSIAKVESKMDDKSLKAKILFKSLIFESIKFSKFNIRPFISSYKSLASLFPDFDKIINSFKVLLRFVIIRKIL